MHRCIEHHYSLWVYTSVRLVTVLWSDASRTAPFRSSASPVLPTLPRNRPNLTHRPAALRHCLVLQFRRFSLASFIARFAVSSSSPQSTSLTWSNTRQEEEFQEPTNIYKLHWILIFTRAVVTLIRQLLHIILSTPKGDRTATWVVPSRRIRLL